MKKTLKEIILCCNTIFLDTLLKETSLNLRSSSTYYSLLTANRLVF